MIHVYFACLQDTCGVNMSNFFPGHHVSEIAIGYPWKIYDGFFFFIMCRNSLDVSGHPLLSVESNSSFALVCFVIG